MSDIWLWVNRIHKRTWYSSNISCKVAHKWTFFRSVISYKLVHQVDLIQLYHLMQSREHKWTWYNNIMLYKVAHKLTWYSSIIYKVAHKWTLYCSIILYKVIYGLVQSYDMLDTTLHPVWNEVTPHVIQTYATSNAKLHHIF